MYNCKSIPKVIIIFLIIVSCLVGLYFSSRGMVWCYANIKNFQTWYYWDYTATMFLKLNNSQTINTLKKSLPTKSTVGFYANLSACQEGYGYIMYFILQNLLAPTLLDKESPRGHEYIIMFLKGEDAAIKALKFQGRAIMFVGQDLYILRQ